MLSTLTTRRLLDASSLYFKVRRRLYHRTPTKREVAARRERFYRAAWDEAAAEVGGSVTPLGGELLEVRCAGLVLRADGNQTSLHDQLTVAVSEDKPLVYRLLRERGIPVPRHAVCRADDLPAAWRFVAAAGRPCVVKPARGTSGAIGVTTAVTTRRELARAMAYGGAFGPELLVEEMLDGGVHRLLYFDGDLIDAVHRRPPTVTGDGKATIEELIEAENRRRMEIGIAACQSLIKIDGELRRTLRRGGRTLSSVPGAGEVVLLKSVVNDNRREDNVSAAETLCPAVVAAGAAAAAAIGVRLAGVDVITPDPSRPLTDVGGVVIEVNADPGFYYHYYKRNGRVPVATIVLQRLLASSP